MASEAETLQEMSEKARKSRSQSAQSTSNHVKTMMGMLTETRYCVM